MAHEALALARRSSGATGTFVERRSEVVRRRWAAQRRAVCGLARRRLWARVGRCVSCRLAHPPDPSGM